MSQHDYNIANAGGATVRADINAALAAIQTANSGASAPTAFAAFMPWYDTTNTRLKMRNQANSAWADILAVLGTDSGQQSLSSNGYQRLPGGVILQWGQASTTAGSVSVTFPIAFNTVAAAIMLPAISGSPIIGGVSSLSATGATFTTHTDAGATAATAIRWIAVGY